MTTLFAHASKTLLSYLYRSRLPSVCLPAWYIDSVGFSTYSCVQAAMQHAICRTVGLCLFIWLLTGLLCSQHLLCQLCILTCIVCRPDAHRSRPFGSLSGGQQALATLALSFALQAAFPSPFYFFDEIDSALDTSNAGRVADYIAAQHGAQYLVVSHKPQVQCFDCYLACSNYAREHTDLLHL